MVNTNVTSKYMRGIAALKFNGETLGYVKKGSFKLNGKEAEYTPIEAEQVPDGPVEIILTKNATIEPTFSLIELEYERLQATMGGALVKEGEGADVKVVGWDAPVNLDAVIGNFVLDFYTGRSIPVPRALLLASITGDVTFATPTELSCKVLPIKDLSDVQKATYGIRDTSTVADEPQG